MSLTPLTDREEIRSAFETLNRTLIQGTQKFNRWVGWPGGRGQFNVYWHPNERFWTTHETALGQNRHILFLGVDEPANREVLSIVCEINPPFEEINRRCAGVFVRDEEGVIYLAHSGKVGGGRKGIGKSAFRSYYRGRDAWEKISWSDGVETEAIVIGPIDGERLAAQAANFMHEVRRFKSQAGDSKEFHPTERQTREVREPQFNAEFSGQRKGYRVRSKIEARCDHGLVISALACELKVRGLKVANDQNRDLFVPSRTAGCMDFFFEAKTEVSTSSIYQGLGQLLFHSVIQNPRPKLIFVLPRKPDSWTGDVLKQLGIRVLLFELNQNQPTFLNLSDVLSDD